MNVGFREAMKEEDWDCLFFHDVDLIPEDDRNTYVCDSNPKHAAIAMDKFGYKYDLLCLWMSIEGLTFHRYTHSTSYSILRTTFIWNTYLCFLWSLILSRLPYKMYFGGVSALTPLHYLKMNGFPNNYWGWGGEDDDIGVRWE